MTHRRLPSLAIAAGLTALALAGPALAQHPGSAAAPQGTTAHMQGNDEASWIADPHFHAFYEITRAAFAQGPGKVDVSAYEQKSFAIFRDFGVAKGVGADHMQDHLKLIPRQVVQIVKEDPKVLDSYDNFVAATFGPR
jgi:hypothetical protein